jgi:hypothetical protein
VTQSKMLTKRSQAPPWELRETSTLSIKIIQTHIQQVNQKNINSYKT